MFYTLASRIPLISNSKSDGKFLKIFIIGSLAYILLHYYLYSGERWFLFEKLKTYLYYVMTIDLAIAYFLSKWNTPQEDDSDDEEKQNEDSYSRNQRLEIERNLQELRRMQSMPAEHHRQKVLPEYPDSRNRVSQEKKEDVDNSGTSSQKSPFMTREEVEKEEKEEKEANESKKTKSVSSSKAEDVEPPKVKKVKKSKKSKDVVETDTHIDVYGLS
jgi:hypothetical protein